MEDNPVHGKLSFTSLRKFLTEYRKTALLLSSGILFLVLFLLYSPRETPVERSLSADSALLNDQIREVVAVLNSEAGSMSKELAASGISALASANDQGLIYSLHDTSGTFIAGSPVTKGLPAPLVERIRTGKPLIFADAMVSWLSLPVPALIDGKNYTLVALTKLERFYALKNRYDDPNTVFSMIESGHGVLFTLADPTEDSRVIFIKDTNGESYGSARVLKSGNGVAGAGGVRSLIHLSLFAAAVILIFTAFNLLIKELFHIVYHQSNWVKVAYPLTLLAFAILLRVFFTIFEAGRLLGIESLDDPSNFSSVFGYGIAGSPANLIITAFTGALFSFFLLDTGIRWEHTRYGGVLPNLAGSVLLSGLAILPVRGIAAVQRSMIYDSSLRYFLGESIFPDKEVILMNAGILMASFALVVPAVFFLFGAASRLAWLLAKIKPFKGFSVPVQRVSGLVVSILPLLFYFLVYETGLLPAIPVFIIVILLAVSVWFINREGATIASSFLVISLIASVVSIVVLSKFNEDLERDSLKKIALEINRPTDTFMRFLVQQSLSVFIKQDVSLKNNEKAVSGLAFRVWSASILNGEVYPFKISVYEGTELKDRFSPFGISVLSRFNDTPDTTLTDIALTETEVKGGKLISGTIPFAEGTGGSYFAVVTVFKRDFQVPGAGIPEFMKPEANPVNDIIDLRRVSIFRFAAGKTAGSFGELQLPEEVLAGIRAKVGKGHLEELYRTVLDGDEASVFFFAPVPEDSDNITVIVLKDKDPIRILFNFFKLFFLHSIFIMVLFLAFTLAGFRKLAPLFFRFRTQLTFSFLVISTIPVVALALFNRDNQASVDEKNRNIALKTRVERILEAIHDSSGVNPLKVSPGIPFTLYRNGDLAYTSPNETRAAFIPSLLLVPSRTNGPVPVKDNFLMQSFEHYRYYSLSRSWIEGDDVYTVMVTDIADRDERSALLLEFDVFLFGVYSLAVILIIIFATILSGRISSPLLRLTRAANSVALGNLDYEITTTNRGEIGELVRGFRFMTGEIKKNQDEIALLERDAAWKEMAKQVAHEVKNPLTPMKLSVQHLLSASKDNAPGIDRLTEKVLNSLLKQIEILNHTASEFSRSAKMPGFTPHRIDIADLIKEVTDLYTGSPVSIKVDIPQGTLHIAGDESHFKRALINLIRNSIQAGATRIGVSVKESDDSLILEVTDNGTGIPEEVRERIFEINFTTKSTGTGLGLKLTRRFVESVGGKIELLETEKGTGFKITFPHFHEKEGEE